MKKAVRIDEADVWRDGEHAGILVRTRTGSRFEYVPAFLERHRGGPGIAANLPLGEKPVETAGVNLHTYFAGLLPEGLRLQALTRSIKTSPDDLFSILIAAGGDTAGDVTVVPSGTTHADSSPPTDVQSLASTSFPELLARSLAAMGVTREPLLSGVQEKVSAATIAFPVRGPSAKRAWILKLEPERLPRVVDNEAFFMRMAADLRLEVAETRRVADRAGNPGLLVGRFDRLWSKESRRLRSLHQEDACQLLDRYPADKYRLTCSDLAMCLSVCAAPLVERSRLLRLVSFSYLIANGDLHGKNVSVVAGPGGLRLSPGYDLLSTLPYGDRRMAVPLDGRDDNLTRKTVVAFGERFGVRSAASTHMLDELCDRAGAWIPRLEEIGFDRRKTADLRRTIEKRRLDLGGMS